MLFQQTQSSLHHVRIGTVTSERDLALHEISEMLP